MDAIAQKIITNYWIEKLDALEIINTKSDVTCKTASIVISGDTIAYFQKLTNGHELAEYTVLLTIFNALLTRYFETVGMIYSDGIHPGKPGLYSTFSSEKKTLKKYLQEVKKEVQTVIKHQKYQKEWLPKNTFENYTNFGFFVNEKPFTEAFPFTLQLSKTAENLKVAIQHNPDFISAYTTAHFLQNFVQWLQNLETILSQDVEKIAILSEAEKNRICYDFNSATLDFESDQTIVQLFENQVSKTPGKIALQHQETTLSYEKLHTISNQFANYLIETQQLQKGENVGVKLERTPNLIISLLAVLKAGATYVPIDVDYPQERINFIENDSQCALVITAAIFQEFESKAATYTTDAPEIAQHKDDLAYIIYTSGTTGKPKGVMISHLNMVSMLQWAKKEFKNDTIEVTYAVTSHCFDLSVFEIFYTLTTGKKIKLLQNALEIGAQLQKDKNILINTVPSSMRALLAEGHSLENVSAINLAGEAFPVDIASTLAKTNATVRNLYGPSEDTTYSTAYTIRDKKYTSIPIGKAIANSQAYILDQHQEPVPIGVTGKLYLGGLGVTKGYLHRPKLTAEKYVANPFKENERMYDTGDLAKWLPDGNILFLGRKDSQVKLRGYRIELGEIEAAIRVYSEEIQQVVVRVNTDQKTEKLVAYIVAKSEIETTSLQAELQEKLPVYMIPQQFVVLEKLPLTPNGKLDTNALATLAQTSTTKTEYVAPTTDLEKSIVAIWEEVLGIQKIGLTNTFFELGGHSLLVGQVINKIYKELQQDISVKAFMEASTIAGIIKNLKAKQFTPIPTIAEAEKYPLTTSQRRIWVLSQFETTGAAYTISGVVKLSGVVNITFVEETFKRIIARHEILRTVFKTNHNGDVFQHVLETSELDFQLETFADDLNEQLEDVQNIPFDLENGPLLRIRLFQNAANETLLSLNIHHIISDGWSLELLIAEFTETYNDLVSGKEVTTNALPIQYKDYAAWLAKELQSENYKVSEDYWLSEFQGEIPVLNLPSFKQRPQIQTHNGTSKNYEFSASFLEKLKRFSTENEVTVFMTLLSGINTLFYRYTRQEDTIIGIPVAGRMHPDVEAQLGLYLNTVAIRTQLSGENSFADVLAHQKEKLIAAYEHQNYPFDELIQKLELQVDTSRSALFDVMVVLQNQQQVQSLQSKANPNGLQVTSYETERTTSQFDVSLTFVEKENLEVEVEFNTDIYDEILMDQLVAHLEQLLNVAIEDPSQKITDLAYITKVETTKILSDFNDTAKPYEAISVIELFEAQVTKTPNAIAVRSHEKVLTYAELNAQANQFANYLSEQHQITQNDTIGVCLERNEQLFVAILAVLKTGATYLPIDAEYPTERIEFIIKDSKCKLLVDEKLLEEFTSKKSKFSIENLVVSRDSEAIAYMIYTSGTTGNPKGVLISQHSFSDYVNTFKAHFQLTEKDTIIQQASIAFDTSIEEIFPILVSGGELIIQEDRNDIHTLLQTCEQHNVSILSTNPAVLQYLNENSEEFDLNFRIVISGGDVLKPSQINNIYQKFDVYNTYGPTESTVCTTYHKIENLETVLPIGKPIANRNVYIVDPASNQLQPIGVAGELCISGNGLANGYWNREETTTEKFVQNPFAENTMIYKSGDMARWRPDGSIDFLGRIDRQVKLRGYRIELAEIEQTIIKYSTAISNCVVTIKEINNEKGLVVYFTATSDIEKSSLKAFIQQKLPEYMVPSFYIQLETIPVTSNGKINYKALPEISVNDIIRNVYTAPENEVEAKLVTIWETILGVENIGTQDNFFELGGHSMKVIQLGNSIQREFAFKLNIKDLYETPTIQHLAKLINDAQNSNEAEIVERIII